MNINKKFENFRKFQFYFPINEFAQHFDHCKQQEEKSPNHDIMFSKNFLFRAATTVRLAPHAGRMSSSAPAMSHYSTVRFARIYL